MSINISKQKRDILLDKIDKIKHFIAQSPQDENTSALLKYIADIVKDIKGKKYGLVFEEHRESINETLENNLPVLVEDESLFIDNGGQMNFLIEGDNLASLKLLEKTHKGKIDIIYIDPPYNTGNKDFIYNDAFVDTNDTFRHSKWFSFIQNRLNIAKNLLTHNGAIFISVDNNEVFALKSLCDEIFGSENFIDAIVWNKKSSAKGVPPRTMLVNVHEYILVYQRGGYKFTGEKRDISEFKNPDNDPRGPWRESNIKSTIKPIEDAFTIVDPNTGREYTNTWAFSKESLERMIAEGRILWKDSLPKQKEFIYEMTNENKAIKSSWGVFDPQSTTVYLKNLLPTIKFDNPKPISLMSYFLEVSSRKNFTILDFFAGSGTTGHAVMKLNAEDGGERKFILCTNNENNICRDVTYERIKRVIDKEDYKASLKYFKVYFVPISDKLYYEYADELLKHVKELVELENAINFNCNDKIAIILTEEELDNFANAIPETCKTVYLGHDVLPNVAQEKIFKKNGITINVIPDYYYRDLEA
ncbi:site-specific DNA-methyltransferase [Campylobacter sp.]|uniref:site-specific DNA-methyltransferase n=1 Tax=Campylobacter sp. TaxID=205 RepID=UPI002AA9005E|nr:site-specific DNA-methyltransferase [Campylobacter sp.]MCI7237265.1 site-specific DNA-methyltransferase [Campylobacter sp.]